MKQLAKFCEQHDLALSLTYGDGDSVWSIEVCDGKHIVYSSFTFKGNLKELIDEATQAVLEYLKGHNQIIDEK